MSTIPNDNRSNRTVTGLVPGLYDKVTRTEIDTVTEDFVYSLQGTDIATVRIIYSDATKQDITSADRTA